MSERGSGTVLAAGLIAVTILAGLALLLATQIVVARTRAVVAADAAALAAAPMTFPAIGRGISPESAAADLALANGAQLVRCDCVVLPTFEARAVEVEVEIAVDLMILGQRTVRATSRAEFVP